MFLESSPRTDFGRYPHIEREPNGNTHYIAPYDLPQNPVARYPKCVCAYDNVRVRVRVRVRVHVRGRG